MSVPTLIDMFMRNTCHAVHDRYKELKQRDLTWEQFLTEVTVMDDEEAQWDSSKRKEDDKGRHLPVSCSNDRKRVKASKKKPCSALSNCADEFQKELNLSKEEYQKKAHNRLCPCCGRKGHFVGDYKINIPSGLGKGRQN